MSANLLFRHKHTTVLVEAMQYTGRRASKIGLWAGAHEWEEDFLPAPMLLVIGEERLTVPIGHWVVRDTFGLLTVRDPGTFDATYEPITFDATYEAVAE